MSERETIERDGRRLVLVPEETLNRLEEAAEDLDDIRAYDRGYVTAPAAGARSTMNTSLRGSPR